MALEIKCLVDMNLFLLYVCDNKHENQSLIFYTAIGPAKGALILIRSGYRQFSLCESNLGWVDLAVHSCFKGATS